MGKFDRAALVQVLSEGARVPVTVTGLLAGLPFTGTDRIVVHGVAASAAAALAVRGTSPAAGGLVRAELALADQSPARLEILDVAGRVVIARGVGALGPGRHVVELPGAPGLPPG